MNHENPKLRPWESLDEREQTELLSDEDVIVRNGHVRSAPHGRFSDH